MNIFLLILIISIVIALSFLMIWISDSSKDFFELIELELRSKGMKLSSCSYPGLFKVGPFEKISISIGKPQINKGAIQYEKTYFRIIELKTKNNKTKKIWVKITKNWFNETKIEFKPKLSQIEK